jgi:hypothetical protein
MLWMFSGKSSLIYFQNNGIGEEGMPVWEKKLQPAAIYFQ